MWYKFNLRTFITIYAIVSILTIAIIFTWGTGCNDDFGQAPQFCHLVSSMLLLLWGFSHILFKIYFFLDHDLLSAFIAWAVHSYIFMLLFNLIRAKMKTRKPAQYDTKIST